MEKLDKKNIEDILALTPMQEGMLFHYLKDPENNHYFEQLSLEISGEIDGEVFEKAWNFVIESNEMLRAVFRWQKVAEPIQIVLKERKIPSRFFDFSAKGSNEKKKYLEDVKISDRKEKFDLREVPLRVTLCKVQKAKHEMIISNHHILYDGWSNGIILKEFFKAYNDLSNEKGLVKTVKTKFKEFIKWNQDQDIEKQGKFWKDYLKGFDTQTELSVKRRKRKEITTPITETFKISFSKDLRDKIEDFVKSHKITLASLLYGAWGALLQKYNNTEDVIFGTTVSGRAAKIQGIEEIVGLFINTLPLRIQSHPNEKAGDLLHRIDKSLQMREAYEATSLVSIKEYSEIENKEGLFDSIVIIENYPLDPLGSRLKPENSQLSLSVDSYSIVEKTHYDLTITISIAHDIEVIFSYNKEFFDEEAVVRLSHHFKGIVENMMINPEEEMSELEIISEEEKNKILYEFNNTDEDYPRDKTIPQLFEEQEARTPDHTALLGLKSQIPNPKSQTKSKGAGRSSLLGYKVFITYKELNEKSNQVAHRLRAKGVKTGSIVGLMVDRSVEMIVGLLAILKAGGAYLPIGSEYPGERIRYMLRDSRSEVILTDCDRNPSPHISRLNLNDPVNDKYKGDFSNLPAAASPADMAYVIYTSGTTGRPKGVIIENRSVVNFIKGITDVIPFKEIDSILSLTTLSFDIFGLEIILPLTKGSRVVLGSEEEQLDAGLAAASMERENITVFQATPSRLQLWIMDQEAAKSLKWLKYLLIGGEAFPEILLEKVRKLTEGKIYNVYGPTETTIWSTLKDLTGKEALNIGKPISNTFIYLLSPTGSLQPLGVPGELCISGAGLSRGYLNNPELTAEKFVHLSFNTKHLTLYKTGDLARWLPDGNIEFIARLDLQVKIRGFRIELREIETQLLKHDEIKEAVVIDKQDEMGSKYLCAYIVSTTKRADGTLKIDELREYLFQRLPGYMVPAHFVPLDKIPLTPNGKIDRKALPEPEVIVESDYIAPRNDMEKKLVEVFSGVLGLEKIGIKANFFSLGGDSIKSVQIQARMNKFGYKLEVNDIFKSPTISELAKIIKKQEKAIDQSLITGDFPLTPIQKELFEKGTDIHHFNQAKMLYSKEKLDEDLIRWIFGEIQKHHDALRITYKKTGAGIIQTNHDLDYPLALEVYDLTRVPDPQKELSEKSNFIQSTIDLEKGPMMKLGLFHLKDGDRLLIVIHHLVIDGISWRILFEDIENLYQQYIKGVKASLPLKSNSFKYWSEKLKGYSKTKKLLKEVEYWKSIDKLSISKIKRDFDEDCYIRDSATISFTLSKEKTGELLTKVNTAYNTEINDILLAGLGLGVKKTFGNEKVCILLEGHGRENIIEDIDISRTVGWFTTIYPVMLDMIYTDDISRQIKEVKETLHRLPNKGIGYGILKHLTPSEYEYKDNLIFEQQPIVFNYLGQFDPDINQMSLFEIAEESPGNSFSLNIKSPHDFSIVGIVTGNRLTIKITYSKKQYKSGTVEKLLKNYEKELNKVIAHCVNREGKEFTPSDFTYKNLSIAEIDALTKEYKMEDIYTLSPMQEGMLFHSLQDPSSSSYLEQISYRLRGELKPDIVEKALNELFKRYDVLRTIFVYDEYEKPLQIVLRERRVDFTYIDIHIQGKNNDEKREFIRDYKKRDRNKTFSLRDDVLMRFALIRLWEKEFEVIWTFHHILMDGWCIGIINREFFEIYDGFVEGRDYILPGVKPYKTYIKLIEKRDKEESKAYWKDYLLDYEGKASLLVPGEKSIDNKYKNEEISILLDRQKTIDLNKLAVSNQFTLNTVIQGVWGIILGRYCLKDDVVFGVVVSGRPSVLEDVETMVGLFINTIPVRIKLDKDKKFDDLLNTVQLNYIKSESHHYVSLAEIQADTMLKFELLDHIIVFENYPMAERPEGLNHNCKIESIGLSLSDIEAFEQTNYNFNIIVKTGETLSIKLSYNSNVYDRDFILKLGNHIENVIDEILENSSLFISGIKVISEQEKNQLLYDFNNTQTNFPKDKTIHELFEVQVERIPDNIAIIDMEHGAWSMESRIRTGSLHLETGEHHLTYKELNQKSNQLALLLAKKGAKPGTITAIMMEPSIEMVLGIMAVLKAGGAYMPIDPAYPQQRITYILEDSAAKILATTRDLSIEGKKLGNWDGNNIFLEDLSVSSVAKKQPATSNQQRAASLAYLIYTSGSTGKPKGVVVEHRSVVNLLKAMAEYYPLEEPDAYLLKTSYMFDVSVTELFGWFPGGGRLAVMGKEGEKDPQMILDTIETQRVTHINFVPSMFKVFVNLLNQNNIRKLSRLKYLFLAGEAIVPESVIEFRRLKSTVQLENLYGPTEASVYASKYSLSCWHKTNNIPIGNPIQNVKLYITNRHSKLQGIGIPGELCISGVGLARGYLNNPGLTNNSFIDYPFFPGEKMYKTGDLARWLPDGNIEFLGRMDHQVKIRGFRIEPGDIENQLLKHERINEAVVLAKEGGKGEKYLCAYIVTRKVQNHKGTDAHSDKTSIESSIDFSEIKKKLSENLPGYMIPSYFVHLEEIPLTSNGKVDRKALPEPEIIPGGDYIAPGNELEIKLAEIWAEVLNVNKEVIGVNSNFFELGGHSLKATILISKIFKELNVKVPLEKIFKTSTIVGLSGYIKTLEKNKYESIKPVEKKEYYGLSSAQKRMYILQQMGPENTIYNIMGTIYLDKSMNTDRMEKVFKELIKRHESLRSSFGVVNEEPVQKIHGNVKFEIEDYESERSNTPHTPHASIIENFVQPFDLSKAPLFRVGLITTTENNILLIDMHHIISDGTSHEVLKQEFNEIYNGDVLPNLRLQYKDYSEWLNSEEQKEKIKKQEEYWIKKFSDQWPVLNLPTDYIRPAVQSFEGNNVSFGLSKHETGIIKNIVEKTGATSYMVILAIHNILLSKLSGQEDIIMATGIAARRHWDSQRIVGMFVNTLALRHFPSGDKTFKEFLKEVKIRTLEAFENQEYQFEDLVDQLSIERDLGRNPIFDVGFTLLSQAEYTGESIGHNKEDKYIHKKGISKIDLGITGIESGTVFYFTFEYCTKLFKPKTIEKFIRYFRKIISELGITIEQKISGIEITSNKERDQLLYHFNNTKTDYPGDKTIHELFEEQIEKTPNNKAVVFEDKELTYLELNAKINQLARFLREKGVKPGTIVGIMVKHSLEMIIGILGILKAGGAYLSIDSAYPNSRILHMLNDSCVDLLLTKTGSFGDHTFTGLQDLNNTRVEPYVSCTRPQIMDLDSHPIPDRSLIDYEKYNQYIGQSIFKNYMIIQATRGCPYKCAYCHKIWPKRNVARSARHIFDEVKLYYDMGVKRFIFVDDIFNLNIKNSRRFFELVLENDLDIEISFPNGLRADILTKDYIDLMVKAGTINISFALETASPRLQKLIKKNLNLEKFKENLEYVTQTYPHVISELFTMHGFPTETEEEALMTLNFIRGMKGVHFPYVFVLRVFPNTDMEKLALENGISREAIMESADLYYHDLPSTLVFDKNFTLEYQARFINECFLSKERLLKVLKHQIKILTEDEIVQKYNSYLPTKVSSIKDLMELVDISEEGLDITCLLAEDHKNISNLNTKIKSVFPSIQPDKDALRVLLLDLSQFFSENTDQLNELIEVPLGLMYLLTFLNEKLGSKIKGKIAKPLIDFDGYEELKSLLEAFKPEVIGIRSLSIYKDFFHETISMIRQWGYDVPIIVGGPYATGEYYIILQDKNIDVVVLGEGEITFLEIIEKIIENNKKLPDKTILKEIPGIAINPYEKRVSKAFAREIINLDEIEGILAKKDTTNLPGINDAADLAYIIYTSGSTGKPKGVMVEHKSLVNLCFWHDRYYGVTEIDHATKYAGFGFDASVWEVFPYLIKGASLYIMDDEIKLEVDRLNEYFEKNHIAISFLPTQISEQFMELDNKSLSKLLVGGDKLRTFIKKRFEVYNNYGPTENTVVATAYHIEKFTNNIPIGKPIDNNKIYIMSHGKGPSRLQPVGIPGELCIGGESIARGYLNKVEITKEKFIGEPFVPNEKIYKTGDLSRWLADGNIEFLGRIDTQVKLRGFRIEIGEIESQLLNHNKIKEALVLVKEDGKGDKYLCAYTVIKKAQGHKGTETQSNNISIDFSEIKRKLSANLPDYMIPSYFVELEKMPLTSNGKVDRKALPEPEIVAGEDYIAPRNEIEIKLAELWSEVLNVKKEVIGINSNFFELGGHSLSATILTSKIHKELNVKIALEDIFEVQTIEGMTSIIGIENWVNNQRIDAVEELEEVIL